MKNFIKKLQRKFRKPYVFSQEELGNYQEMTARIVKESNERQKLNEDKKAAYLGLPMKPSSEFINSSHWGVAGGGMSFRIIGGGGGGGDASSSQL